MQIIQDAELQNKIVNKIKKRKTKKTQIFLFDTFRRFDDYFNKLVYRKNGKYEDIPSYIVNKLGQIYEIHDSYYSTPTFNNPKLDNKMIKVAIENLGWLNKNTITGYLNNWIGDPYRKEPYIKNWRNYFFWDRYTDEQLNSLNYLLEFLCEKHNIPKKIVPSQGYIHNIYKHEGVICKSNFSDIYTDINPSFNFNLFFKYAKEN